MSSLSAVPTDDATLLCVLHALDGCLTFTRPDGVDAEDDGPWLVGADYSLATLLDFLAGCSGRDPNEILIQPAGPDGCAEVVEDTRVHYSEQDLIRALVLEVQRLRGTA